MIKMAMIVIAINNHTTRSSVIISRIVSLVTILTIVSVNAPVNAKEAKQDDPKALSGISIVGNKEAPKSLFIVPWKISEIGVESDLSSDLLNEKLRAVDKDVFARELEFYSITTAE